MREIEYATSFRRDFKREAQGTHKAALAPGGELESVLKALANDQPLAKKYRDHALTGELGKYRDCHIKPDLVLIYGKPNPDTLRLVRLGSHSELFR